MLGIRYLVLGSRYWVLFIRCSVLSGLDGPNLLYQQSTSQLLNLRYVPQLMSPAEIKWTSKAKLNLLLPSTYFKAGSTLNDNPVIIFNVHLTYF